MQGALFVKEHATSSSCCWCCCCRKLICPQSPLFGRLTAAGRAYLLRHCGFEQVESLKEELQQLQHEQQQQQRQRLAFVWPNKSGPQFDWKDASAAHIRPYPKCMTDVLDDKVELAKLLANSSIAPPCFDTPEHAAAVVAGNEKNQQQQQQQRFFVKHRWGVKGKSVHVCSNLQELQDWWQRQNQKQQQKQKPQQHRQGDFCIQQEIGPPALWQNCKFVMRSHILLFHSSFDSSASFGGCCGSSSSSSSEVAGGAGSDEHHTLPSLLSQQKRRQQKNSPDNDVTIGRESSSVQFHALLSKNVICQQHAAEYTTSRENTKAAHVSQAGKNHPLPVLLQDLDPMHPAATTTTTNTLGKIVATSQELIRRTEQQWRKNIHDEPLANNTIVFALLGIDSVMDCHGNIQICEVNSHPALGWGTMSQVPKVVFVELIEDVLEILLLNVNRIKDDEQQTIPGWIALE